MKKKIYTHENRFSVENLKNMLEREGLGVQLKNEYLSGAVGDLSPFDSWPELWVDEADVIKAEMIVAKYMQNSNQGEQWHCTHCDEMNEPTFEICWQCAKEKPE